MIQSLLCIVILVVSSPLWLILGLLSFVIYKGRILYSSQRCGLGGKPFAMYKFVTMEHWDKETFEAYLAQHPESEQQWRERRKLFADPRCGRWGRFLRRFSLDEVPQLLNVLKGDMNLVGPRPITAEEEHLYGWRVQQLHSIKPGITGLWQVSGRNLLSYRRRAALEIYYVRHQNAWLDIVILCKTVLAVVGGRGAF